MVERAQQEVALPAYSYADKVERAKTFARCRYVVNSWNNGYRLITNGWIVPLPEIAFHNESTYYTMPEAIRYFEYVIGIVSGAIDSNPKVLQKAIEDLFKFLQYMKNDIQIIDGPDILDIQTEDQILRTIQEQFAKLNAGQAKREKDMIALLNRFDQWFDRFGKVLARLEKDLDVQDAVAKLDKKT